MKYQVIYKEPRIKKGFYYEQKAVFLDISDAMFWQKHVEKQGAIDIEVIPLFS
jgi:hypothetical protein